MKSVLEITIGDVIGDSHHNPREVDITEPYKVRSLIAVAATGGSKFIQDSINNQLMAEKFTYHNKNVVVMEEPCLDINDRSKLLVKAAWSYDDRTFGLMVIEVDTPADY